MSNLESKNNSDELYQKEMEKLISETNKKTLVLLEKLKSNLQEVKARGGQLYVFCDENAAFKNDDNTTAITIPGASDVIAPIVYSVPLQLLSYHVAVIKGTDVDQPRNWAKSVTVE